MAEQLDKGHLKNDLYPTIALFHANQRRLEKGDLHQYEDLKEIEDTLKDLAPSKRKQKQKLKSEIAEGGQSEVIYEDSEYIVVRVDDKPACISYGKDTKWCITMENAGYFEQYSMANVIFYFILRKHPEEDNFDKIALVYQRDNDNNIVKLEIFDKDDSIVSESNVEERIGDRFQTIKNKTESDALQRPKGALAKLKSEELSEEETDDLWETYSIVPKNETTEQRNQRERLKLVIIDDVNPKYLSQMMNDEDYEVRYQVAKRIDPKYLFQMMNDEIKWVREQVTERIDPKYLPQMMNDESEDVRWEVAKRIDPKYLPQMMNDNYRPVIKRVTERIDPKYLPQMMNDESEDVRTRVAERIDPKYLSQMMNDESQDVRTRVAERIDPKYLSQMMNDEPLRLDAQVRYRVAKRIDPKYLPQMMNDNYRPVRYEVAKRIDLKYLSQMMNDESPQIRKRVAARMKALNML